MAQDGPFRIPVADHLDLHAFSPRDVPEVAAEYIEAAWRLGLRVVRLVHGRGIGVQRAAVHRVLARHARVVRFYDAPESSLGATIAELRGDDDERKAS